MYLNFFGLRQTPFGEVDLASLFWTPQRQDLAAAFYRTLVERRGMLMLTGEEGSGKTTFVRAVLNGLAPPPVKVITLSSEKLSFSLLLDTVIRELGGTVEPETAASETTTSATAPSVHSLAPLEDIAPRIRALHAALLATCAKQEGSTVVLVIDNAHQLPVKTLKDIHWLSILETKRKKLLQTIFVGNATLLLKLEMPQLQQLKRCIATYGELAPFSFEESFVYLLTRIRAAIGPRPPSPLFSVEALRLLARHGKGNPHTLNTLANTALHAGAARQQRPISGPLMLEVVAEARTLPILNRPGTGPKSLAHSRLSSRVNPRQATLLPIARLLLSVSMGALAAALVLFFYYSTKKGWDAVWQKPFDLFRRSTVAQASPSSVGVPTSFSLLEDQSPAPAALSPPRITKSDPNNKKRRRITKFREKPKDRAVTASPTPELEDSRPRKAWHRSPGGPSPHDLRNGVVARDLSLSRKILYRVPSDSSSNRDRLFDE